MILDYFAVSQAVQASLTAKRPFKQEHNKKRLEYMARVTSAAARSAAAPASRISEVKVRH
jgi:hypothetical protein